MYERVVYTSLFLPTTICGATCTMVSSAYWRYGLFTSRVMTSIARRRCKMISMNLQEVTRSTRILDRPRELPSCWRID
ncbi:hypothetical protein DEU56DRAFT_822855 [Suillus clintonianus]|uniref:uncharacterized protein n=1 Tax=Suillus clintonianus TaxID=1904413 RepID=UPI001B873280|nr:uncharacterized protein DEU56DRAFT_822855 [Suillus clintonianus]KAG2126205.1 hypothetical protein DEU56DRAFT_822855 [Suillus clintonianus]